MPASVVSSLRPKLIENPGRGLVRSVGLRQVPDQAWTNGRNVRFDRLGTVVRKVDGYTPYDTTPGDEAIRLLFRYAVPSGESILIRVGLTKAWRDAGITRTQLVTGLIGSVNAVVTAAQFEDQLIWTDQADPVKQWTPTGGVVNLPGGAPKAAIVLVHKGHVVLLDVVDQGVRKPWRAAYSAVGNSGDWTSITSGDLDFLEESGGITAAGVLGESIIVHKERSLARMLFVGDPDNYGQEPISGDDGAISRRSPVRVGSFQFYMGHNNFYRLGAFPEAIGDDIWPEVISLLDLAQKHLVFGYHRPEWKEVHWRLPIVGSNQPGLTVMYNYRDQTWSLADHDPGLCFMDLPSLATDTWDSGESALWDVSQDIPWDYGTYTQTGPLNLFGQINGMVQQYGGVNAAGAPISWYLESKVFEGGDPLRMSRLLNVILRASGTGAILVRTRRWMDDRQTPTPPAFGTARSFSLSASRKPWVDVRTPLGRLHQVRFEGAGLDEDFLMEAWGPAIIPTGSWR